MKYFVCSTFKSFFFFLILFVINVCVSNEPYFPLYSVLMDDEHDPKTENLQRCDYTRNNRPRGGSRVSLLKSDQRLVYESPLKGTKKS